GGGVGWGGGGGLGGGLGVGGGGEGVGALGGGVVEEVGFVEPFRADQHRPRHLDVGVEGELLDGPLGRVGHRREPVGEARQRLGLDPCRDLEQHVVEQVDLLVRVAFGADEEEIGDPRQGVDALVARAGGKCLFQLVDQ